MKNKPSPKTGFSRVWAAFFYSVDGLRYAIKNEAAFRQEVCVFVGLLVILPFLPISIVFKSILIFANITVLIVELINSAIESIVDIVSPEYNILAKHAKDLGSAAVLVSIILAIILWAIAIYDLLVNMI